MRQGKIIQVKLDFMDVKVGDSVRRIIGAPQGIPMHLIVTELTDSEIHCGDWRFDRLTGAEIDEDLGWGPNGTGSYLTK